MRGGIFINNYMIDTADFRLFIGQMEYSRSATKYKAWLEQLPKTIKYTELIKLGRKIFRS